LGRTGAFTNPVDRGPDYTLQAGNRAHDFRTNGTFELPIGPNRLLLANSSGTLARIVEGWTMSWIFNTTSGAPADVDAATMLYANGVPDVVGPFDPSRGSVQWQNGAASGNYFGGEYTRVVDPQCSSIAATLQSVCTLNALVNSTGQTVLQNPKPGTRGNLGRNALELPGTWSLDSAMSKRFQITESKRLQLRVDAINILNHPQPAAPSLSLTGTQAFGDIATKTGSRSFQAQVRLDF
jgi:hypothetical protein